MTAQRATFTSDRLKQPAKRFDQPKKWSHQTELDRLKGKDVVLFTKEGPLPCKLLDSDQFTLRVSFLADGGNVHTVATFFKHSLNGYGAA